MNRIDDFFEVISHKNLSAGLWEISLHAPAIASHAQPGQFCMIDVSGSAFDPLLRRPLSLHAVSRECITFLYRVVGKGTELLSHVTCREKIRILGPVGTSFNASQYKTVILAGGGIGAAPLFFLAHRLANHKIHTVAIIGGRTKDEITVFKKFEEITTDFVMVTEDGSAGVKGVATLPLEEILHKAQADSVLIAACGPLPMMKAVHDLAITHGTDCQVSLESHMACGAGLCLGCAIPSSDGGYLHICREGPVTDSRKIF